jgi:hypothetical protein
VGIISGTHKSIFRKGPCMKAQEFLDVKDLLGNIVIVIGMLH